MKEQEKPNRHGQKKTWKTIAKYDSYAEADHRRKELAEEGATVKVHRCDVGEDKFAVKVGTPFTPKEVQNDSKEG